MEPQTLTQLDRMLKHEVAPTKSASATTPPSSEDWGRKTQAQLHNTLGSGFVMLASPTLVLLNWIALENYNGSLLLTIQKATAQTPVRFLIHHFPKPSLAGFAGYTAWLLFQALLYTLLPGPSASGQMTPGGNRLKYTANGLLAWAITHVLFFSASYYNFIDPALIATHWPGLLVAANVYGLLLCTFAYLKGHLFPTYPSDRKFSGSWVFDFFAGVELNPRIGKTWDLKFFHNGRPGIVGWTLINASWAAWQWQRQGRVTGEMVVVQVLQAVYVVDFFWNEDWYAPSTFLLTSPWCNFSLTLLLRYCRTLDISHDHFGFMLAWGDTTWLPTFYTLQAQYLARYPTHLSLLHSTAILLFGLLGYYIFRSANHQRNWVRSHNGNVSLWGKPATYIPASYTTSDGKEHTSLLLTSGWWGVARHVNYVADLMQAFAFCATCGVRDVLPWLYFFYMVVLLLHRMRRDDRRCRSKYGEKWDEYCRVVRWRLVPGVY